jgi:hypothetical protein
MSFPTFLARQLAQQLRAHRYRKGLTLPPS